MATYFKIPTSAANTHYTKSIVLSGVTYVLELRYNTRMDRWVLNIRDNAEQPILLGVPLLIDRNLTGQYTTLSLPPGILYISDNSGKELQPTLSSFLLDHTFWYRDPS